MIQFFIEIESTVRNKIFFNLAECERKNEIHKFFISEIILNNEKGALEVFFPLHSSYFTVIATFSFFSRFH